MSIWENYLTSDYPGTKVCIEEWKSWLAEIENGTQRQKLEQRLKSELDSDHFSARQELFFHHFFKFRRYPVVIEPDIAGTGNKPDFLVGGGSGVFLLEAKVVDEAAKLRAQEEFSKALKEELEAIESSCFLSFSVVSSAPPIDLLGEVKSFVEKELIEFIKGDIPENSVMGEFWHLGTKYRIDFTVTRENPFTSIKNLFVMYVIGFTASIGERVYEAIEEKANRYGKPDKPFVIAIWEWQQFGTFNEKAALYGQQGLQIVRDAQGRFVHGSARETRIQNGIFTIVEDGRFKYEHVSAIVFYQQNLLSKLQHILRVYHNPYASRRLDRVVFADVHQYILIEDSENSGHMEWVPNDPEEGR